MSNQLPVLYGAGRQQGGGGGKEPPIDEEFTEGPPNNPPPNGNRAPGNADAEPSPPGVEEHKRLFRILQIIGLLFIGGMIVFGIVDWNGEFFTIGDLFFNVGPVPIFLGLAYLIGSLYNGYLTQTEIGGAYFYGMALKNLKSGLNFLPLVLIHPVRMPKGVFTIQIPDNDPEKIFHGADTEPLDKGMVRTLRILTGGPVSGSTQSDLEQSDALHVRMMLEAIYGAQFQITSVIDFVGNYENMPKFREQLRDVGDPTLAEAFSTRTPADISKNLVTINQDLRTAIGERFEDSGVVFLSARVTIDPGRTVAEGLAIVPVARAKAQATILEAEGKKTAAIKEGEGIGTADKKRFIGRGKGLKAMRDDLGVSGDVVIAAETARAVAEQLSKAGTIVIGAGGGMGDIVAAAKVIQETLKK